MTATLRAVDETEALAHTLAARHAARGRALEAIVGLVGAMSVAAAPDDHYLRHCLAVITMTAEHALETP